MVDVKVPVLAESVAEATLLNWHKKEGDTVKRGENLIDIETDKVTLEVSAVTDGTLSEILRKDGETVQSEEIIARIEPGNQAKADGQPEKQTEQPPAETVEAQPKDRPAATSGKPPEQQPLPVEETAAAETRLSPAVRNLLKEHNLDPARVPASHSGGRLTKEDVMDYLEKNKASETGEDKESIPTNTAPSGSEKQEQPAEASESAQPSVEPDTGPAPSTETETTAKPARAPESRQTSDGRTEQRVPMTRLRQRTAERLLAAQHENAILTTFNEVNMKPVMDLRARYKESFEKEHKVKLGFMSFFTRAATEALKKFPVVNASIDGKDILYHDYFDIGIAVSTDRGLVVPVIRDADTLSFAEIEAEIAGFGEKARNGKLTIEDLTGGTFTITNGGIFGSLLSTPILNPPQSAILGMHKIQERPMAVNGEPVILPMMYLALSYDHRIIDGREAVQFLVAIKEFLEDPTRLLLQI